MRVDGCRVGTSHIVPPRQKPRPSASCVYCGFRFIDGGTGTGAGSVQGARVVQSHTLAWASGSRQGSLGTGPGATFGGEAVSAVALTRVSRTTVEDMTTRQTTDSSTGTTPSRSCSPKI